MKRKHKPTQSYVGTRISDLEEITRENINRAISGTDCTCQPTLGLAVVAHMNAENITVEQLADQTHLSPKTIQRIRTKTNQRFDHKTIIALCVGLHLDVFDSHTLLRLAGLSLTGCERDRIYQLILNFAFQESVESCNRMLFRLGMEPLTGEYPSDQRNA